MMTREQIANELVALGWPAVADDVREGMPFGVVLSRLQHMGEGNSDAAALIAVEGEDT